MSRQKLQTQIKKALEGDKDILFAYLFGSHASGRARPDSDIDVAVYLDPDCDLVGKQLALIEKLSKALGTDRIDVVVLNTARPSLRNEVVHGRLLLRRSRERHASFVSATLRIHWDFDHYRPLFTKALQRKYGHQ